MECVDSDVVSPLEAEALDFSEREVLDFGTLAGFVPENAAEVGAAGNGSVVAEDQDGVGRHLEVQLHDVRAHADDALDGGDGVLREVAPVSAMACDYYVLGIGIVDLGGDGLGPVCVLGCLFRTRNQCKDGDG